MLSERHIRHLREYCVDYTKIENFDKAVSDTSSTIWRCHHRLETHYKNGKKRDSQIGHKELIDKDLYYNRPPEELILLTASEHSKLHHEFGVGVFKGKDNPMYGKTAQKGKHWYNNGKENYFGLDCPEGYKQGRLIKKDKYGRFE